MERLLTVVLVALVSGFAGGYVAYTMNHRADQREAVKAALEDIGRQADETFRKAAR